jgi:hypothetical protein
MRKWILKNENPLELHMKSREQVLKAVRKVKGNGFSAPGMIPSKKNKAMVQFESEQEKDFCYFLEFSLGVSRYVEQPVKIEFISPNGKKSSYTPDFLVYYSDDPIYGNKKPTLFEVKARKDIKRGWAKLKPKFLAAMRYCDVMGWKFKIITEVELNDPYYKNAKFLAPYMSKTPSLGLMTNVLDALHELEDEATPAHVIAIASNDFYRKVTLITALWHLIATRVIKCNLEEELTMNSPIWFIK